MLEWLKSFLEYENKEEAALPTSNTSDVESKTTIKPGGDMADQDINETIRRIKQIRDKKKEAKQPIEKVTYEKVDSQARDATEYKQQVHDASFLLDRISSIHEAAFAMLTPSYSTHNFAKIYGAYLKKEGSLSKEPYFLRDMELFKNTIKFTIASKDSGFNEVTYEAFTKTVSRGSGKQELIEYCKDHKSSLSDRIAYCSENYIDYVKGILLEVSKEKKEGKLTEDHHAFRELALEGEKATLSKQQVHGAGFVLSRVSKIYEDTYANMSNGDKSHNFAKFALKFIKNPEIIKQAPYEIKNDKTVDDFFNAVMSEIDSDDGGISKLLFELFRDNYNRKATDPKKEDDGINDLIKFCKLQTQSPSEEKAYCTKEFIDHTYVLLATTLEDLQANYGLGASV